MLISILDRWLTCKVPSLPLDAVSYPLPCLISIYHRLLETFDSLLCLYFCCCSSLQTSLVSLVFLPCLVILPWALFIVGFLTGAFDEDDAPVSSCAVSASSTLGVLLPLGMLMVAPNACGCGCFPLTLLALGGLVVVDRSSWNSLFSCVGGLKGFLFSAVGIAVVSIGSLASGATSTFVFDFSSFNFFWLFTFLTCLLINFCVGFILDGFSSSSSSGMMASVSFDAICCLFVPQSSSQWAQKVWQMLHLRSRLFVIGVGHVWVLQEWTDEHVDIKHSGTLHREKKSQLPHGVGGGAFVRPWSHRPVSHWHAHHYPSLWTMISGSWTSSLLHCNNALSALCFW